MRYDPTVWAHSVDAVSRTLQYICGLENTVRPENLADAAGMFLTMMYAKNVTPDWWLTHFDDAMRLVELSKWVTCVAKLREEPGIPEAVRTAMASEIDKTVDEINKLRLSVASSLKKLNEVPDAHVTRN